MAAEFETYAMRGLVAILAACLGAFIWREIRGKDAIWKAVHANRVSHENDLKAARREFTESLDRVAGRFSAAVDSLNQTVAALTQTVARLDATMAKEYATKEDLREVKDELRRELDKCAEVCPGRS